MNGTPRYLSAAFACAIVLAQQTAPPSGEQSSSEVISHDTPATFRTKVNLVLVPVLVRDAQGHAVGDLKREDFQLYDRGKLQVITRFTVEKGGAKPPAIEDLSGAGVEGETPQAGTAPAPVIADRYTAYLFDDIHLVFGDLARTRDAADRHIASTLEPTERAAIYATSGQDMLDFTDDRGQIHDALLKLRPRTKSAARECPPMTYYEADLIENKHDPQALNTATQDALVCGNMDPTTMTALAQQQAEQAARRELTIGEEETRMSLNTLKAVIRRLSAMPGYRSLVLVSPGFITPYLESEVTEMIDVAIRAGVTINTLDARGLFIPGAVADASQSAVAIETIGIKERYARETAMAESMVLAEIADGTSGTYYHDNNDLNEGFKRTAEIPEFSYLLGFSPQDLKLDGGYHALKVKLKPAAHLVLQARRGYYAPKHLADPGRKRSARSKRRYSRERWCMTFQPRFTPSSLRPATSTPS